MGIKHLTYLDLTPEQRRQGAKVVKAGIRPECRRQRSLNGGRTLESLASH